MKGAGLLRIPWGGETMEDADELIAFAARCRAMTLYRILAMRSGVFVSSVIGVRRAFKEFLCRSTHR